MVMPWKLTTRRYTNGKSPMSSSTAIEGTTSTYRKPRSRRPGRGDSAGATAGSGRVARDSRFMGSGGGAASPRPGGPVRLGPPGAVRGRGGAGPAASRYFGYAPDLAAHAP